MVESESLYSMSKDIYKLWNRIYVSFYVVEMYTSTGTTDSAIRSFLKLMLTSKATR
jgi:hypothetical protein